MRCGWPRVGPSHLLNLNVFWVSAMVVSIYKLDCLNNFHNIILPSVFLGSQQHDAQELSMFLFDMLHEDVNRIKVKPSMSPFVFDCEIPDRDNALRFIALRKKREDSVVEDLFGGLLKSSIHCPLCNAQSVSLDSIRVIPLSLPSDAAGCSLESRLDHFF